MLPEMREILQVPTPRWQQSTGFEGGKNLFSTGTSTPYVSQFQTVSAKHMYINATLNGLSSEVGGGEARVHKHMRNNKKG